MWNEETEKRFKASRRISSTGGQGLLTLGDFKLWDWEEERWRSKQELIDTYGVGDSCAQALVTACAHELRRDVKKKR